MGMEEEQGTTPHRTDQRPQTALLALSTSPVRLTPSLSRSVPMPSNLLASCFPHLFPLSSSKTHSWLRFGLCARWRFGNQVI